MRTAALIVLAAGVSLGAAPDRRVAYDDAGNAAQQPHLLTGASWTFENPGEATPAARTVVFGPAVAFGYAGLTPRAAYAAKLRFFSDGDRTMRIRAGDHVLEEALAVAPGKTVEKVVNLPAATYAKGQLRLTIELISGPNAAVSEVEILSDNPTPLTALPEPAMELPRLRPRPARVAGCAQSTVNLGGTWKFNPSPGEDFAAAAPGADWRDIQVPGEWVMQGFTVKSGTAAGYTRTFDVPKDWSGQRVVLRCDAVFSEARVWINGREAGRHLGGFTPFELDITELVTAGRPNTLTMAVTSETVADTLASASKYACHPLGGITRGIRLFALPAVHVTALRVATTFDTTYRDATLEVDLAIEGDGVAALRLADPDGQVVALNPQRVSSGRTRIPVAAPRKWDPEHPHLYTLTLELEHGGHVVEVLTQRVGFRQIEVRGNELFVNGRPVKTRGSNHHEVYPITGRSMPPGIHRRDVELFREANVNLLRTCHYPPDEALMEAADELGLFIECEAPFCWAPGDGHRDYVTQATAEMVLTYRNHPSVLWWSLGNESTWGPHFIASSKVARQLDPTRPQIFNDNGSVSDPAITDLMNFHYPGHGGPAAARKGRSQPVYLGEDCHLNAYNRLELATDPALRDLWGRYTRQLWDDLYETAGCLGQSIWSGVDDTFYLPNGDTVGYGTWGPIDGWRRTKPEYWGMKKAYSPIRLIDGWNLRAGARTLQVGVENRFLFTDLAEARIAWRLGGQSGTTTASIPPGRKGSVTIELAQTPPPGAALELDFLDPRGFVADQFRLALDPVVPASNQPAAAPATITETPESLTIVSARTSWRVDRKSGLLAAADSVSLSGPALMLLPLNNAGETQMTGPTKVWTPFTEPCTGWACTGIAVRGETIVAQGRYDQAAGTFTYSCETGGLAIAYAFTVTKDVNPRQVGLVFTLPHGCETLTWERTGYWDVYPDDHIARLRGTVRASEGFEATSVGPRTRPPIRGDWTTCPTATTTSAPPSTTSSRPPSRMRRAAGSASTAAAGNMSAAGARKTRCACWWRTIPTAALSGSSAAWRPRTTGR